MSREQEIVNLANRVGTEFKTVRTEKANAAHTHVAADVTDFDAEVSGNADVAANTAKVSADGSVGTHSDVDLTGISDGDVLAWVNGNNRFEPTAPSGGGGASALSFYKAAKNTTAQLTTDTYSDLTGWTELQNCNFGSFDAATGIFTFSAAVTCLVIPDVQATQPSGSNRTQLQIRVMEDTGSGFAADATKEWFNYSHRNSTQNDGGMTPSYVESYDVNDQIKIQISDVGTAVQVEQNQARFQIINLEGIVGATGPAGPAGSGGQVDSIANAGNINVDNTDPVNPALSVVGLGTTQITNQSSVVGASLSAALNTLDADITTLDSAVALNTAKVSADGSVGSHSDVDLSGISDGDTIVWSSGNSRFEPGAGGGGGATVEIFSPTSDFNKIGSTSFSNVPGMTGITIPANTSVQGRLVLKLANQSPSTGKIRFNVTSGTAFNTDALLINGSGTTDGNMVSIGYTNLDSDMHIIEFTLWPSSSDVVFDVQWAQTATQFVDTVIKEQSTLTLIY